MLFYNKGNVFFQFKCLVDELFLSYMLMFERKLSLDSELTRDNWYLLSVLELCFNRVGPCWEYVSIVLRACFNRVQPCSRYVSTVFDGDRGRFQICARPKPLSRLFFYGRALT